MSREEFTYQNMIRLVGEKNEEEIRRIFDTPYTRPLPSKLPAGKIIFDLRCEGNVCSELDLARAEGRVTVNDIRVRSFLHAREKTGYIELNIPAEQFSFYVENPEYAVREKDAETRKADEDGCGIEPETASAGSLKQLKNLRSSGRKTDSTLFRKSAIPFPTVYLQR